MNPLMTTARNVALKYGVKNTKEDKELFKQCWKWRVDSADKVAKREGKQMEAEVSRQFDTFAATVKGVAPSQELGHRYVLRQSLTGRNYVIFSDHHWAHDGNRQKFFNETGNRELYIEILGRYFDAGYTLIENGDVEEMIIFDPSVEEITARAGMNDVQLKAHRELKRARLFDEIVNHPKNKALYAAVRKFHDAGRYIKIAGNHDYNLQEGAAYDNLKKVFPNIPKPYDYVLLESGGKVAYAVLHGHQFDTSTTPVYAARVGETISESMSWAYQGADRIWNWKDDVVEWVRDGRAFHNVLVNDDHITQGRWRLWDILGGLIHNLHTKEGWENVFQHRVAWEYFTNSTDPQKAVDLEVKKGKEWFKYRHLDELRIKGMIEAAFVDEAMRPRIVLGHSHEVRLAPVFAQFDPSNPNLPVLKNFPWYYNTGAAGRFENLIWGLEIGDGVTGPKLVGFSRPKPREGHAERREFSPMAGTDPLLLATLYAGPVSPIPRHGH